MRVQKGLTNRLLFYALLAVFSSILVSTVYAVVSSNTIIQSSWAVSTIGVSVYWDVACTDEVVVIDWSILEVGSSENKTVYIKNTGNETATLFLDTDNWNPSVSSQYITLVWDYGGQSINPGSVVEVVLTLTVSPFISGIIDFSFDVIIVNEVNDAPVANAGLDQSVIVGDVVSFDGSGSYDPDGAILSYEWDFGDGEFGSGESLTHVYISEGTYTVTLTVTDDGGLTSLSQVTVIVESISTEPAMHVEDITLIKQVRYRKTAVLTKATYMVTVLDSSGAPVKGATVHVSWSNLYKKELSGVTNVDGMVSFKTRWIKGPGTLEFSLTGVVKTGWIYDPDANMETWISIEI
jgi:PKD repeat protein